MDLIIEMMNVSQYIHSYEAAYDIVKVQFETP
jgi:hypothetical protein